MKAFNLLLEETLKVYLKKFLENVLETFLKNSQAKKSLAKYLNSPEGIPFGIVGINPRQIDENIQKQMYGGIPTETIKEILGEIPREIIRK